MTRKGTSVSRFHRARNALRVLHQAGYATAAYDGERNLFTGVPGWRIRLTRGRTDPLMRWLDRQYEGIDPEGEPIVTIVYGLGSTATRTAKVVIPYREWVALVTNQREERGGA